MKVMIDLTIVELAEILHWADSQFTQSIMSEFGGQLSDRLWETYKRVKDEENSSRNN